MEGAGDSETVDEKCVVHMLFGRSEDRGLLPFKRVQNRGLRFLACTLTG